MGAPDVIGEGFGGAMVLGSCFLGQNGLFPRPPVGVEMVEGLADCVRGSGTSVGIVQTRIWAFKCRSPHAFMRAAIVFFAVPATG